jgi:hypothetical protein
MFRRRIPMTTDILHAVPEAPARGGETVRIRAHNRSERRLGHWTAARRFDVRASRASVILELRSPRIEEGDIEIFLDLDHATVKLLVPEGAVIDHDDVRRVGRCGFVDWSGQPASGGRRVVLRGEMRSSELRINRGGIAIVSAMLTREYREDLQRAFRANDIRSLKDVREAYRAGRWTTIEDPGRSA